MSTLSAAALAAESLHRAVWFVFWVLCAGFGAAVALCIASFVVLRVDFPEGLGLMTAALQAAGLFAIAIGTLMLALLKFEMDGFWRLRDEMRKS